MGLRADFYCRGESCFILGEGVRGVPSGGFGAQSTPGEVYY